MKANPDKVRVKIGFRKYSPDVEVVNDVSEKMELMQWYIEEFPRGAKMLMGWDNDKDELSDEILAPFSDYIAIIRLKL
jgi:hypothetical protein